MEGDASAGRACDDDIAGCVPYLVVDSNVLFDDWLLNGERWQRIVDLVRCGLLHLRVPEIVIQESVRLRTQQATKLANELVRLDPRKIHTLLDVDLPDATEIKRNTAGASERYEADFRARLDGIGAHVLPIPTIDHQTIVSRALACRQPFDKEGKKGYRDTLIWYTILSLCENLDKNNLIVFVTNNTGDFCGRGNPAEFSPELVDEIRALDNAPRFRHYMSIDAMLNGMAGHLTVLDKDRLDRGGLSEEKRQQFRVELVGAISAACDALCGVEVDTEGDGYPYQRGLDFMGFLTPFEGSSWVEKIEPHVDSITWEFIRGDVDDTVTFAVSVKAYIAFEGMIHKADWAAMDDDSVAVLDNNWNDHYVEAAEELPGILHFQVVTSKSLDTIERVDLDFARPLE
jgi:hypothetical protein